MAARERPGRGRRLLGAWLLLTLGAVSFAWALSGLGSATAKPLLAKASGAMRIAGSNANGAILSAGNLAPGESVSGTVAIRNRGSSPAALKLSSLNLQEGGGAPLAAALQLAVRDRSRRSEGIVYAGTLAGLQTVRVGALAPGEGRRYAFVATLPASGPSLDSGALAGAWARVDFRWTLTRSAGARCATKLSGDAGPNRIVGTVGGDRIDGLGGADKLYGEGGADCLVGGPGRDRLFGGAGNDEIRARDGAPDLVDCGPGQDVARVDKSDTVRNCETVR
jgi:Ca2+-binding RTX toxin-like protein